MSIEAIVTPLISAGLAFLGVWLTQRVKRREVETSASIGADEITTQKALALIEDYERQTASTLTRLAAVEAKVESLQTQLSEKTLEVAQLEITALQHRSHIAGLRAVIEVYQTKVIEIGSLIAGFVAHRDLSAEWERHSQRAVDALIEHPPAMPPPPPE